MQYKQITVFVVLIALALVSGSIVGYGISWGLGKVLHRPSFPKTAVAMVLR